jgi:hypothetical protein
MTALITVGVRRPYRESQLAMSLINDGAHDLGAGTDPQRDLLAEAQGTKFAFVPRELAGKCRELVHSYHSMHGYRHLADMLWHSDARDIIECNRDLAHIFKDASKSRYAKRANDSLVLIATIVLSIEVLARDFAGWGKRFPVSKREAEALLVDFPQRERGWFMDKYLYPSLTLHREFANVLSPPGSRTVPIRN